MSWVVGLSVTESFAEATAKSAGELRQDRWYLPHTGLGKGFENFCQSNQITDIQAIRVQANVASGFLKRRLGNSPAVLVTSGFENWLEMSLPVDPPYFTMQPRRLPLPFDRDLVFGLSERTLADGHIERSVDQGELDFLISKLEMSDTKTIALGLLHANKNSENEKQVEVFFKERGFQVFPSYHLGEEFNERHRWWHAVLNAYLTNVYEEYKTGVLNDLGQVCDGERISWLSASPSGTLETAAHDTQYVNEIFSLPHSLYQSYKHQDTVGLCYLGLEEFLYVDLRSPMRTLWRGPYGPVHAVHPAIHLFGVQPTQQIAPGFGNVATFTEKTFGFEPGPMCFGRSLKPYLLDVLFEKQALNSLGLSSLTKTSASARIRDTIHTMSQSKAQRDRQAIDDLFNIVIHQLAMEILTLCPAGRVCTLGPLAASLSEAINRTLKFPKLELLPNGDAGLSLGLLESTR